MAAHSPLVLIVLFSLTLLLAATTPSSSSSSSTAPSHKMRRLGFYYSRTRGRCTPQYWSSGREKWPRMVPRTSTFWKVFGSRASERFGRDLTLMESTVGMDGGGGSGEGAFRRLAKQASAALLNSYARKGFPYTPWEVKTLLIQAMVSEDAANLQARQFTVANEACT